MPTKAKSEYEKTWDKAHKCSEDYCRLCGRDVYTWDSNIICIETKRKTICLIHTECMLKEIARGAERKTRRLVFTEVRTHAE